MFSDAKIGDRVWDIKYKWGTIEKITSQLIYVEFDILKESNSFYIIYYFNGKENGYIGEKFGQTLFWDEIKFEIPEKPFDLEKELRELDIIEFRTGKDNYFLTWSNKWKCINSYSMINLQDPFSICFTEESINNFMDNIKDKEITKEQFFAAYKNVFGEAK